MILGNTGSGKSTFLQFLILQVATLGVKVWVSDLYKKQLRHLRPQFARVGQELIILRPCDWKYNPLQAAGRDPQSQLSMCVDLLVQIWDLPSRAVSILRQALWHLYQKYSIWDGRTDEWPNLFDLYEWLCDAKGLNPASRDAILDRLGALLVALTPASAAYRLSWEASDLANHSIIFEMRGVPEPVKQLLPQGNLFSLFHDEIERGVVNGPLSLLVAFEDAQRFFNSDGQGTGLDELAGICRGSGIGIAALAQSTQGFSRSLTANLATKIMGRLGLPEDWRQMGSNLAMTAEQIAWAQRNLKPGTFIGQTAEGNWREPFVFNVPLMKIPSSVSDTEASESVRALDSIPVVAADEYANWAPRHIIDLGRNTKNSTPTLSDMEFRFLKAVVENPGKSSSVYKTTTRISGKRVSEIRKELVKQEYVREHEIATSQRGRAAKVIEPLKAGIELIKNRKG